MRKGFIFTMDAMIAISIVIMIIITVAFIKFETIFPEKRYERLNYIADDIMNLLSYLEVRDIQDKPTVKSLIASGILTEKDLKKSVLDLIGSFWYVKNETIAENISKEVLEEILDDVCINLTIDTENIYSSCDTNAENIAVGTRIESGYEAGKPKYGYISRAWATRYRKNTTEIIPFLPEGSGWNGKRLEVMKKFHLPTDVTILNATLYVSIHYGGEQSQAEFEQLKVNGVQKKNDIVWIYLEEHSGFFETTTAAFGYVDVTNELQLGNNTIYLVIGSPHYNSHLHPGMRLIVTYSLEEEMKEGQTEFNKTHYFDDVIGKPGAWATMSFFLPPESKNRNIKIRIHTKDVDSTGVPHWAYDEWHYDVEVYLNTEDPIFYELNPESEEVYEFDMDDISDYLLNGTNVLSVFLNCYGDVKWGGGTAEIYSDPLNDPTGSSHVNVSYTLEDPPFSYGEIDITKEMEFGGDPENPKTFEFELVPEESDIMESSTHLVQGFSALLEEFAWHEGSPETLVFKSPAPRVTPSWIYISPSIWSEGDNSIRMRDFQPDGSTSPGNYILPWTTLEYKYLVSGMVGYGEVFNTSEEAVQDAHERLSKQLGDIDIISSEISMENITIRGIEWLWGPSLFKIVVWEK